MNIAGKDYEIINFNRRITNKREACAGLSFARGYLAISDNYRLYNTHSGDPIIRGRFVDLETCLWLARLVEDRYRDYFDIWLAYPQADLISWCKYSATDGAQIFEIVEYLKTLEIITQADVQKAVDLAREQAKKWR